MEREQKHQQIMRDLAQFYNEPLVKLIRELLSQGTHTQTDIAKILEITPQALSNLLKRN